MTSFLFCVNYPFNKDFKKIPVEEMNRKNTPGTSAADQTGTLMLSISNVYILSRYNMNLNILWACKKLMFCMNMVSMNETQTYYFGHVIIM